MISRPVVMLVQQNAVKAVPIAKPLNLAVRVECTRCSTRGVCIPDGLKTKTPDTLDGVFGKSRKIRRGEAIYRAGDTFHSLYITRAGSSKTVAMHRDGREQITGFQITGEFLGMEGIGTGKHTIDAIALEDSVVCAVPFKGLETLGEHDKDFQRHLHKIMSREIVRESALLMLIGSMTAEERVAAFLINLSKRFNDRGYSPAEFHLKMTREEIGCHLGLKLETVSRMFSKLQQRGLIEMHGKQTRIIDIQGLDSV
uniref:helix-turn-helix domain-containing protein n=1 Tax=Caballeronia sp. LjRoot34 TaxID=3342325 RepID=UPI003F4F961F